MKKMSLSSVFFFFLFSSFSLAMGNSQDTSTTGNANTDQARQDYRLYMEKLKELSQQYSQITSEVKKVIKEEGVPAWDEQTGTIKISHDVNFSDNGPVRENEKEIKIILELPGLKKESIRIQVENERVLRIQAVKKAVDPGSFEQPYESIYELASAVQDKNTSARYEDGILTVTLQKLQAPKKIVPIAVR